VAQQGQQTGEEVIGERLLPRDGGRHRVGEHAALVVTEGARVLPRQPQGDRASPLQQDGRGTHPQRHIHPRIPPPARRPRVAQHSGNVRDPVLGMLLFLEGDVLGQQMTDRLVP